MDVLKHNSMHKVVQFSKNLPCPKRPSASVEKSWNMDTSGCQRSHGSWSLPRRQTILLMWNLVILGTLIDMKDQLDFSWQLNSDLTCMYLSLLCPWHRHGSPIVKGLEEALFPLNDVAQKQGLCPQGNAQKEMFLQTPTMLLLPTFPLPSPPASQQTTDWPPSLLPQWSHP